MECWRRWYDNKNRKDSNAKAAAAATEGQIAVVHATEGRQRGYTVCSRGQGLPKQDTIEDTANTAAGKRMTRTLRKRTTTVADRCYSWGPGQTAPRPRYPATTITTLRTGRLPNSVSSPLSSMTRRTPTYQYLNIFPKLQVRNQIHFNPQKRFHLPPFPRSRRWSPTRSRAWEPACRHWSLRRVRTPARTSPWSTATETL